MTIVEKETGNAHRAEISRVSDYELTSLSRERYFFDWTTEQRNEVYKLHKTTSSEALGLISINRIQSEWRIHIRLLTVSKENKGNNKIFDRIAGNLIAYISKLALRDYGELACVSLKPKSKLIEHYITTYHMAARGNLLSLEVPEILNLVNEYDDE